MHTESEPTFTTPDGTKVEPSGGPLVKMTTAEYAAFMARPIEERQAIAMRMLENQGARKALKRKQALRTLKAGAGHRRR